MGAIRQLAGRLRPDRVDRVEASDEVPTLRRYPSGQSAARAPRDEGAPVEEIRGATRRALENIVQLAIDERVTCVVIAGDLYDGDRDDYNTALFLQRQLARLQAAAIPVAVIYGNHDAASEITRRLRPPDEVAGVRDRRARDVGARSGGPRHPWPGLPDPGGHRRPVGGVSAAAPGLLTSACSTPVSDGRPGHEPYAPTTPGALAARGYAYWALGHVHERDVIRVGDTWIVFPGNPQGRHAREPGPRGVTLVEYDGTRILGIEERIVDTVRWIRCPVDAADASAIDEALGARHRGGRGCGRPLASTASGRCG